MKNLNFSKKDNQSTNGAESSSITDSDVGQIAENNLTTNGTKKESSDAGKKGFSILVKDKVILLPISTMESVSH
jgi:hypothetical protein